MEISTKGVTELAKEASVVTPEASTPSNGRSVPSNTKTKSLPRSSSVGDRLYQQGRESERRKKETAAAGIAVKKKLDFLRTKGSRFVQPRCAT
mmetsp:Transcript_65474/g.96925  ORF Transcript_65474/g.96925 Transcript_65474/m.96925 type:complete len:93 (+) Transcript_65474:155-433(+)